MIAPFVLLLHVSMPAQAPACATCFAPAGQSAPAANTITGVVRDSQGGAVAGAVVIARLTTGAELQTVSGSEGRFVITGLSAGEMELIVRASGFAEKRQTVAAEAGRQDLSVEVAPASVTESVTVGVTRNEQLQSDVPASVSVIGKAEIRQTPASVADDVLRQIPSFSLFRRTSSLVAHPTTQGVSLRGIGPSGVSRTLVLLDGIPFNDPFGGWVFWSRIPLESAERIEVSEGSSSSLYGNYAMGGLISIVTAPPARRTVEFQTQYGNLSTPKFDVRASDVWGKVGVTVDATVFDTNGYATVYEKERGPIDSESTATFKNINLKLDYAASDRFHAFVRTGYFREERDNGKTTTFAPITEEANDTTWKALSGGVRVRTADGSDLQASVFYDNEDFRSNNVAVPNTVTRDVGRLSLTQAVPSKSVGGMGQWARAFHNMHLMTAGVDYRWVDGDSNESGYDAVTGANVTVTRSVGGTQQMYGVYFQDLITPVRQVTVTLSARFDHWRNYDGHSLEYSQPSGTPTVNHNPALPGRDDSVTSPRIAALYHVTDTFTVWGDIGAGFRAPTLNELYRGFRVGTKTTLPNYDLGPERLVGGEFGVSLIPTSNLLVRATAFDNHVRNPVANLTVSQVGANVTLQRKNLGRTSTKGGQVDAEYRLGKTLRIAAGYLYGESRVTENPADATLVGKYLPQVPKHRGSLTLAYTNPKSLNASVFVQAVGRQYDDDQNIQGIPGESHPGLPAYAVVGVTASRQIEHNVEVYFAAQNLFNQTYFAGTLPSLVGSPRLFSGGVRFVFRGQ